MRDSDRYLSGARRAARLASLDAAYRRPRFFLPT